MDASIEFGMAGAANEPLSEILKGFLLFRALKGLPQPSLTRLICSQGLDIEQAAEAALVDHQPGKLFGMRVLIEGGKHDGKTGTIYDGDTLGAALVQLPDGKIVWPFGRGEVKLTPTN